MGEEWKQDNFKHSAEWLAQVKKRFEPDYPTRCVTPSVSIYRVPIPMFSLRPECYLPQIVALGPYHCQMKPKLSLMEEYKLEALHRIVGRISEITAPDLVAQVEELEDKIRESYEEVIDCDGETLAWMLTMDACFILEFLRSHRGMNNQPFNLLFRSARDENIVTHVIIRDILKLENQIPLFLLRHILTLESPYSNPDQELEDLVLPLMELGNSFVICNPTIEHIHNASHLLDLFHKATRHFLLGCLYSAESDDIRCDMHCSLSLTDGLRCFPSPPCNRAQSEYPVNNLSADALRKFGIKIRLSKTGKIYFERRFGRSSTLFLPEIKISDNTEPMLLNLMAFETCKRGYRRAIITRFVCFLVFLITSQKDIDLLTREKVIVNYMGSNEKTAALFKDLCDQTAVSRLKQLDVVLEQVAEHCNSRTNQWISQFKEEYCSKPWYLISLAGAVLLLVLTFVQTIYSVRK